MTLFFGVSGLEPTRVPWKNESVICGEIKCALCDKGTRCAGVYRLHRLKTQKLWVVLPTATQSTNSREARSGIALSCTIAGTLCSAPQMVLPNSNQTSSTHFPSTKNQCKSYPTHTSHALQSRERENRWDRCSHPESRDNNSTRPDNVYPVPHYARWHNGTVTFEKAQQGVECSK